MTITQYIKSLQKWVKLFPNATVIYSADNEGNGYEEVHFLPHPGKFTPEGGYGNGEYKPFGDPDDIVTSTEVNAICVN